MTASSVLDVLEELISSVIDVRPAFIRQAPLSTP